MSLVTFEEMPSCSDLYNATTHFLLRVYEDSARSYVQEVGNRLVQVYLVRTDLMRRRKWGQIKAVQMILRQASSMHLGYGLTCTILLWLGAPTEVTSLRRNRTSVSVQNHGNTDADSNFSNILGKLTNVDSLYSEIYSEWTKWSRCDAKCEQKRFRRCRRRSECGRRKLKEKRVCRGRRSSCSKFRAQKYRKSRRQTYIQQLLYEFFYDSWSAWGPCSRSCKQRRIRRCSVNDVCRTSFIQEERRCSAKYSACAKRNLSKPTPGKNETLVTQNTNNKKDEKSTPKRKSKKKKHKSQNRIPSLSSIQESCGFRPDHLEGSYRVVGGQEAQRLSWPWQVAITTRYEEQYCGGTLIAPQWVLTAAHCVRKRGRKRKILVRMGEHDFQSLEGTEITQKPSKDFPHPDFDYHTISNDIGLVKLRRPVHRKTGLGFACLPSEDEALTPDTLCTILGWGKMRNTHLFGSNSLQEAKVPIVEPNKCREAFDYDIQDTQVCAGYKRGGTDSCAGDSGGPLLCSKPVNNTLRWFVYGVTSYGEGCGRKGKFGIYTKVSSFVDWIKSVIDSN